MRFLLGALALALAAPLSAQALSPAVVADPPVDGQVPAEMAAFQLPSHGSLLNAVFYLAAGRGPHPTLLLLHGFPGNEQNLDLAQAVRRAGWNVLTLHYRGSWGSAGAFSFAHCAEDANAAVAFLRSPEAIAKYRIDPSRIVVGGHSMGGMMAAHAAANDTRVAGLILIDAWDIAGDGRKLMVAAPADVAALKTQELAGDLPPLTGTSVDQMAAELAEASPALDLVVATGATLPRPMLILGAERANGPGMRTLAATTQAAGGKDVSLIVMPTDHSFSDHRLALEDAVVRWLARFGH
jgi:pimeloyl-ACP methyl ester carboxylesterase